MLAEWYEASNSQNLDVLVDHYEDGGTILAANWPAATGSDAIREYFLALWADTTVRVELDGEAEEVHISGDLAILRGTAQARVTPSDGSESWANTSRFVEVYRRQADGSWKSLWDIWNSPLSISELASRMPPPQG
jgi:ketosteroid isomerase-like protein